MANKTYAMRLTPFDVKNFERIQEKLQGHSWWDLKDRYESLRQGTYHTSGLSTRDIVGIALELAAKELDPQPVELPPDRE